MNTEAQRAEVLSLSKGHGLLSDCFVQTDRDSLIFVLRFCKM